MPNNDLVLLQINQDVASAVESLGFDKKWLIECIQRREQTKVPSTNLLSVQIVACVYCLMY